MKKSIFTLALLTGFSLTALAHAETTVTKSTDPVTGTTTTTSITRSTDTDPRVKSIRTEQQFTSYAYSRWDKNADGFITPDEWDSNVVTWYGPEVTTYKTYADWDLNRNGKLDEGEFRRVVGDTGLYKTWNVTTTTAPGVALSADASFAAHDLNGDGKIVPSEWNQTYKP